MAIFQRGANFLARLPADDNSTAGLRPRDGISFQFRAPTPAVRVPGAVSDSGVGLKIWAGHGKSRIEMLLLLDSSGTLGSMSR